MAERSILYSSVVVSVSSSVSTGGLVGIGEIFFSPSKVSGSTAEPVLMGATGSVWNRVLPKGMSKIRSRAMPMTETMTSGIRYLRL